ncbi:chorismate synthase aroF [Mycobacterium tuberculosis]|nr:chorismate synthase aroF [Mycobacterium tuberculosis]
MLRWITAGESHGRALVAVVEGMVAGVHVTSADIADQLARRRLGYGRGARMTFERDAVTVLSGIRHGSTLGGPIAIEIGNTEWPKWETVMAADPVDPAELADVARNAPLTRPRPGHADYAGMLKYGFDDARPVLERASARETAARVAAGTVARAFLRQALGVEVLSHVISIGASAPYEGPPPRAEDLPAIDASPVRAYDKAAEADMIAQIEAAKKDGDTLGGVVEAVALGLPVGLGSFTSGDHRLDSQLAAAVMGIQAIKGVEIGDRIPDRAPPRQPRPRRDVPRARRRRPLHQPGRGAGRRDDQRAAAAGACGDEADLHGAARAGHRRPGDRR